MNRFWKSSVLAVVMGFCSASFVSAGQSDGCDPLGLIGCDDTVCDAWSCDDVACDSCCDSVACRGCGAAGCLAKLKQHLRPSDHCFDDFISPM
ncbi:MAG: hypothetical protein ACF8AM_03005, partial [Rhodopirellula sp. JB055]